MSIVAAIRTMLEKGLSLEHALIAAEALEETIAPVDTRSKGAIRTEKWRERKASQNVTERHKTSQASQCDEKVSPSLSPKEKSPPITPSKEITPISTPSKNARDRALFDRFWKVWPNRIGKPAAYRAFGKVSHELDAILLGVERYIRDKPPDRSWLNPATFLNQRRWEDEPAQTPCALAKPKERDLRSVPDNLLSADDYWKKRKQQREWA